MIINMPICIVSIQLYAYINVYGYLIRTIYACICRLVCGIFLLHFTKSAIIILVGVKRCISDSVCDPQ